MLFVQDQYQYLVTKFIQQEHFFISQFANQEYKIDLSSVVKDHSCLVVGSLTTSPEQALQLLLLLHTLQEQQAAKIILFSPYLSYQRQDKFATRSSSGLLWADAMLSATGIDQIITIEPHNYQVLQTLKIPVIAYNSAIFFQEEIAHFYAAGFGFIFPDAGAVSRHHWVLETFTQAHFGYFEKRRLHEFVQVQNFQGKVGRKVMIIDDILDSGQTLVQLCYALRQLGVEEIVIFVTHAFFHGYLWHELWNLGVNLVYCTNTVPGVDQINHPYIRIKSIDVLLQKFL